MNDNRLSVMEATMEAAVDAKIKSNTLPCPDREAIREDELYFRNRQGQQKQSFQKIVAVMLACASGGLLMSMNLFANKQGSPLGLVIDILALCIGAGLGYYSIRQKR